jgi:hypothetical protein
MPHLFNALANNDFGKAVQIPIDQEMQHNRASDVGGITGIRDVPSSC